MSLLNLQVLAQMHTARASWQPLSSSCCLPLSLCPRCSVCHLPRPLQAEDEALLKQPSKGLCRNFKRLRQAFYKEKYKERKAGPAEDDEDDDAGAN